MGATGKPVIWTAEETAAVLGAVAHTPWSATGVCIDSRSVEIGDLFVAISGPNHDAHDYVVDALSKGAVGAIVHADPTNLTDDKVVADRMIRVANTLDALMALAGYARKRSSAKIIAVTGSVGKTGTKEMLKLVLSDQGRTAANIGNLNNHWGLPLSLARMPRDTEFGIFEMGMNHAGEIRPLSLLATPDVCVITNVEQVHSAFFDSVEQIAEAKAEIFAGLKPEGTAILNVDSPMHEKLSAVAGANDTHSITTFGEHADADYRLISATSENARMQVAAAVSGVPLAFEIGIPGRHWALNAMCVLAAVSAVGADVGQAARKLADMHGVKGRGAWHSVEIDGGAFVVIDESYNASPVSMAAAIEVLGGVAVSQSARRIAVLGDMLELGDTSEIRHRDLIEPLIEHDIDLVFTAGQYMAGLWDGLPVNKRGGHAVTAGKLLPLVISKIRPGDIITVKGSAGSKTGVIVEGLLDMGMSDDRHESKIVNGN
jgi:UDP-N-acetylmuramoyl-tripeptide--D-alanyl-D-alanine ligase